MKIKYTKLDYHSIKIEIQPHPNFLLNSFLPVQENQKEQDNDTVYRIKRPRDFGVILIFFLFLIFFHLQNFHLNRPTKRKLKVEKVEKIKQTNKQTNK